MFLHLALVLHKGVVEAHCAFRMAVQEVYLLLEFVRRSPVIVAFKNGDVFASAGAIRLNKIWEYAEVSIVEKQPDLVRVLGREPLNNAPGAVPRTVLGYHDFTIKRRFLYDCALDRLSDRSLLIVCDHQDADFHRGRWPGASGRLIARRFEF